MCAIHSVKSNDGNTIQYQFNGSEEVHWCRHKSFHALTRDIGLTQQSTCTMSCLISRLVEQYNPLMCACKKGRL
jgi:hypothetical protein